MRTKEAILKEWDKEQRTGREEKRTLLEILIDIRDAIMELPSFRIE